MVRVNRPLQRLEIELCRGFNAPLVNGRPSCFVSSRGRNDEKKNGGKKSEIGRSLKSDKGSEGDESPDSNCNPGRFKNPDTPGSLRRLLMSLWYRRESEKYARNSSVVKG